MWLLNALQIKKIIHEIGFANLMNKTIFQLREDYSRWSEIQKYSRHAIHHKLGVLELMPCADNDLYSFKYVNGHPNNTNIGKMCVAAFGMLAKQDDGYPLLLCDMTWLTAIRTAATVAMVAECAAPVNHSNCIGIIGAGAQSEFMLHALSQVFPIEVCYFMDNDRQAMQKFKHNMQGSHINLIGVDSARVVAENADILTTITAAKKQMNLVDFNWLKPGALVCGVGGDTPGKTEFSAAFINKCRIIVEYLEQTKVEGEIQNINDYKNVINIYELITNTKNARVNDEDIVLFDSVGFALEDFSILKVIYNWLLRNKNFMQREDFFPKLNNPKDLFGELFRDCNDT